MKSNTIYLVIILFLISTNIATIVSTNVNKNKSEVEDSIVANQPRASRMNFLWNELGLNEEQIVEAVEYNTEYNRKARLITIDLTELRHQIVEEMSDGNPDKEKLGRIISTFGARHIELKRETVDFYYQLHSICDSSQRGKLEFVFRDMLDPEGMIYGRGRGGQGRGREFIERGPRGDRRREGNRY
jgi:hypothetical protein